MPKNFMLAYWKTIFVCIVIFILSTVTFKTIPDVAKFHNSDKLTHAIMYIGLGLIAYFEFKKDFVFRKKYRNWLIYMFLSFAAFGGIIEILQEAFFKPRTGEFLDWIADIVGLLIGLTIGMLFFRFFPKSKIIVRK